MAELLAVLALLAEAAALRALSLLLPKEPPMLPEDPRIDADLYARWLALPQGPVGARLLLLAPYGLAGSRGRLISREGIRMLTAHIRAEHSDDGEEDLSGIAGLGWRLMTE